MMTRIDRSEKTDAQVQQILDVLAEYKQAHPNAQIEVHRKHDVSLRIRMIDPDFRGIDWIDRESEVWKILEKLPDEVFLNITMLLLLTPEETQTSWASMEFDHPIPSPF